MTNLSYRFLGVVGLQFLLLFGVIGYKQYTVATGETVVLKVVPVDPRSLFRGDYVRLSYDISTIDPARLGGADYLTAGETVFVELAPGDGGYWSAVAVYQDRRSVEDGHVLIKGKATTSRFGSDRTVRVEYGVEEVFVPEGSGRAIETSREQVGVEVKVDRFGNAVARKIVIEGR
jgi:uncharacterized membrane-anchored protein